jgi:hypothetical protein
MTIRFLGATADDFFAEGSTVLTNVTTSNARDASYSTHELRQQLTESGSSPMSQTFTVSSDMWLHYRTHYPTDPASQFALGEWFQVYNDADELLMQIDQSAGTNSNGSLKLRVYGDSTVSTAGLSLAGSDEFTVDINLEVTPTAITATVYHDGSSVLTATAANTSGLKAGATRVVWLGDDITDLTTDYQYYSEFIITDAESTIGWRLATLMLDGTGTYTDFEGGWDELSDMNFTTVAATDTANDRVSSTVAAYNGPVTPTGIRGVFGKAIATKGDTGPANALQFLRISATDYDGTSTALAIDNTALLEEWAINPATGVAWTTANLAAIELGIKAET